MEKASLCRFMLCACCKSSQCLSFSIPDKLPVLSSQNKHWLQNSLALRTTQAPPVRCILGCGVWASFLILLTVNTAWSEVITLFFISSVSPGTLSRKNTELSFSQESCSPLFPIFFLFFPEFCMWHKAMLSRNLPSRFSSGILEAKLPFILVA